MDNHADLMEKWARENDARAEELRQVALTDPARYKPAMQSARAHERAAKRYRDAARPRTISNLIGDSNENRMG